LQAKTASFDNDHNWEAGEFANNPEKRKQWEQQQALYRSSGDAEVSSPQKELPGRLSFSTSGHVETYHGKIATKNKKDKTIANI
jgi:hypothetical protein